MQKPVEKNGRQHRKFKEKNQSEREFKDRNSRH